MDELVDTLNDTLEGRYGSALLLSGVGVLAALSPSPLYGVFLAVEKWNSSKLSKSDISPDAYYVRTRKAYEFSQLTWPILAIALVHFKEGDSSEKLMFAAKVLGIGAAIGLLLQYRFPYNIEQVKRAELKKRDNEEFMQFLGQQYKGKRVVKKSAKKDGKRKLVKRANRYMYV